MAILDEVMSLSEVPQGKLVIVYGKSASGKTQFGSTFPKPMLYVKIGDDGVNTIKAVKGIDVIESSSPERLKKLLKELKSDKKYQTIFLDTFTLIVNEWKDENIYKKKKKMSQQNWGDLLQETEEIIRLAHELSLNKWVILSGHEVMDSIEGMEDELLPDVRIAVSKGARTYVEGMANYGIHTVKIQKDTETDEGTKTTVKYAADIGPNSFYWTKLQIDPSIKVPKRIINPTFEKLMKIVNKED